jgi:hypothetical protein
LDAIESLPEFDELLRENVKKGIEEGLRNSNDELQRINQKLGNCERIIANIVNAIGSLGHSDSLKDRLREEEGRKVDLLERIRLLETTPKVVPELPSIDDLKVRARNAMQRLAVTDPDFGRLMQRLIPRLEVIPVRLIDGGGIYLRARITLDLNSMLPVAHQAAVGSLLVREIVIDLFELPQRAAFRQQIVELRANGLTEREAANTVGLTITASQKAMALHRMMITRGLSDPIEIVTAPPNDIRRVRRHRHPRYRFEPLDGYPSE